MPMAWPRMVASRMPVSVTRHSPYFSCNPLKPWFTSPRRPTSSPKAITRGSRSQNRIKGGVDHLKAIDRPGAIRIGGLDLRHLQGAAGVQMRTISLVC